MKVKYYSYGDEIIEGLEYGKIHVFPKNRDKSLGRSRFLESVDNLSRVEDTPVILMKQPKIIGLKEFKTNLFLSDKITLREEKQVIAFYRALTSKNKADLGVANYYDVIDIAANFLNFFKLLKEYRIKEVTGLRPWQERIYKIFLEIEKNYLNFLDEKNYIDPIFIIDEKNFTLKTLKGYKEVIFYNKLYFTELEKWIIEKLEENGFEVVLKLQLNKDEFDEDNLSLKDITWKSQHINAKKTPKIDIYTVDDEFGELLKLIDLNAEREIDIFDSNNENYKYNNFFNQTKYISKLPIFSLLEGIHRLLSTLEIIDNEIAIELYTVAEILKWEEVSKYYDIRLKELESLKNMIKEGYKYLTKYIIAEKLGDTHFVMRIFEDIEVMKKYESLEEWVEKITFSKELLGELLGEENIGKYFEALSEIAVIEELDIVNEWKGFFGYGKKSEGLLKLILKYLEFKEVKNTNLTNMKKSSLEEIETRQYKKLVLINTTDNYIPSKRINTFLLTEQQKKNLGIKSWEYERLEEKYNFFRGILSSEEVTILGIKNEKINSAISPFVEELLVEEKVKSVHLNQEKENYLEIMKLNIEREALKNNNKNGIAGEPPKEMRFDIEELKKPFKINAYLSEELFNCKYKANLRYLERLEKVEIEVEKNLTRREYGILAHELFEEVLNQMRQSGDYTPLELGRINTEKVIEILKEFVGKRRLKLPKLNEKYYEEIVYKNLANSVDKFFIEMSKEIKGEKIFEIVVEKNLERRFEVEGKDGRGIEVVGVGKADLIIKTNKNEYIIDFKTGNLNELQLDFYGILHSKESSSILKYIFNVDKGTLEKSEKIKLVEDEEAKQLMGIGGGVKNIKVLEEELEQFFKGGKFKRKESSKCNRCEYLGICKVGELDGEE